MDTKNLPKTRKEAQASGAKYYFTGEPCKHGHIAPRKTKGSCVGCLAVEWKVGNEKRAEYFKEYNRRDDVREKKHEWYEENREKVIATAALRPKAIQRDYKKAWKLKNKTVVKASNKSRRRKHREATPPWLTSRQKAEIRDIYKSAITLTKLTGVQYVVDHICPLRSDEVCGLHVPWNLRVITKEENLLKSNKLIDTLSKPAYMDSNRGLPGVSDSRPG